ncbi:MAG: AIM24 family protein [Anaerococcus sp.]|nr:AIM24 family protein [Anaerococcus sp.]
MFRINNFKDNDDIRVLDQQGAFTVFEYKRDLSVTKDNAMYEFYASQMNVKLKQVICDLSTNGVTIQQGAMQWMVGDVSATTGIKGVSDFLGKSIRGAVTKESAIKPEYVGDGKIMLEPTYKHIILIDLGKWNNSVVLEDGYFLACDSHLKHKAVVRSSFSSAVAGNEGFFNLGIEGDGIVVIESPVPKEELIEIELDNDQVKIDGNYAIAWSKSLKFTVERSGKSLIGSAASGEGLVNVYRGSGKIWMAPIM